MRYEMIYDICVLCCVSCFEVEPKAYRTTLLSPAPFPVYLPFLEILLCYVPFVHPHLLLRKNNNNNIIKETLSTHILINHIQHYHHYN